MNERVLLAVFAHPDDESFCCDGTGYLLQKIRHRGFSIAKSSNHTSPHQLVRAEEGETMHPKNRLGTLCAVMLIVGMLAACRQPATPAPSPIQALNPTAAPSPGIGRGMMGRGMTSSGHAPGGLVAVSRDGKALAADPNSQLPENAAAQKVGDLNISLALSPYPPVSFQSANFDVTLTDATGQAITDAKIALDLTMPAMPMPPNKLEAQHAGNGRYHATGRFTMPDWWRIEVIIQRGNTRQSAFFDVWV